METEPIWETILNVPVGRFVAWVVVIATIIVGIAGVAIKLYKFFGKVRDLKEHDEEKSKMLLEHDKTMREIDQRLGMIQEALDIQKEVNLKQVRYQIVHTCDEAIAAGSISAGKLRSLEELFEEYTRIFHGNGYVRTLMNKIRKLQVTGSLDE